MQPSRRKFLLGSATAGAGVLAGCTGSETSDSDGTPEPDGLDWTGRFVHEKNMAWASRRNLSDDQFSHWFDEYSDRGYIIIDVGANTDGHGVSYSMVWRENVDDRAWAERRNMTASDIEDRHEQYTGQGMRPLTIEGYRIDGEQYYAGIWIENEEDLDWWADWDLTNSEFKDEFEDLKADDFRPIDVETYPSGSGERIASIWWEDVDDVEWAHFRNMSREKYLERSSDYWDDGFRTIDFESYVWDGDRRYAAIWEKTDADYAAAVRTNRSSIDFSNYWREYADKGLRIVDQENYGDLYGGIWIESADRYRYEHKDALTSVSKTYRDDYNLPGLSVAVIEDGKMMYRRGFGYADKDAGREAHGRTIYLAASVSKIIGGTLAARLENVGQLRDGTSVDLDMSKKVDEYLTDIPAEHDYTVEELFAHIGCVPHYDTTPDTSNPTSHYESAEEAAAEFWDLGLIDGCQVGDDRNYSTYAFTVGGAVLEEVTGKRLPELVRDELAEPYGLDETRVMFDDDELPENPKRAVPYDDNNDPIEYDNNSWKVFGGGIESSVDDLARFGWKVLDAQIVDEDVRDDRLWSPVDDDCSSYGSGTCRNGIAWRLMTRNGEFAPEHGGQADGAGAYLRVFPKQNVVIAMMSNKHGNTQDRDELMTNLAKKVL